MVDLVQTDLDQWVAAAMKEARSLEELVNVARIILTQEPEQVMLCGPMTTGGMGNLERNLRFHRCCIKVMRNKGLTVFDQTAFAEPMIRVIPDFLAEQQTQDGKTRISRLIIDRFYEPLFSNRLICKLFFRHNWESSVGSKMERFLAKSLLIPDKDFPADWNREAYDLFVHYQ